MSSLHPTGFLTKLEAAEALRCSQSTIVRMIAQGRLKGNRIAEKVLIPVEEIKRLVKATAIAAVARPDRGGRPPTISEETLEVLRKCPFRGQEGGCTLASDYQSNNDQIERRIKSCAK